VRLDKEMNYSYPQSGQRSQLVQALAARDPSSDYRTYNVTWLNDTTAQVSYSKEFSGTIYYYTRTYAQFPSVDAATAYFYSLAPQFPRVDSNMLYCPSAAYSLVTGHDPTVIRGLIKANDVDSGLYQTDDVVTLSSSYSQIINQA
jgi:hypothetical protein